MSSLQNVSARIKFLDAPYFEEFLELQDIWDVIVISQGMNMVYNKS
jgi:hypothetical protein